MTSFKDYFGRFPEAQASDRGRLASLLSQVEGRSDILDQAIANNIGPKELADAIEAELGKKDAVQIPPPQPRQNRPQPPAQPARPGAPEQKQPFWRRFTPNIHMPAFPQNWWMWPIAAVGIAIAIWQGASGNLALPNFGEINVPNSPGFRVGITLAALTLITVNLWGFAEAYNRKERMLMDWWIAIVIILVLVERTALGHDLFLILTTASVIGLAVATFLNESEEQASWFDSIDLTSLMNVAGQLLILHYANWQILPYPEYIPVWILWIIFVICVAKELLRTALGLGFFALITGVVSAVTLNAWVITISLVVAIVGVHFAAKRGWVNTTKHRDQVQLFAGTGRELSLLVPWDVILAQTYVFAFTSFALYGNFVIVSLTGGK